MEVLKIFDEKLIMAGKESIRDLFVDRRALEKSFEVISRGE